MEEYFWSDSSALYILEHSEDGNRKASAKMYLEMRLEGYTSEEIKRMP